MSLAVPGAGGMVRQRQSSSTCHQQKIAAVRRVGNISGTFFGAKLIEAWSVEVNTLSKSFRGTQPHDKE
jgi:hypothetical protein